MMGPKMAGFKKPWTDKKNVRADAPIFQPKRTPVQQRRVKTHAARGFMPSRNEVIENGAAQHFRAVVVMFALTLAFAGVGGRLAFVGLMPPAEPRASIREMPAETLRRGNIYDRNNVLLAATLKVYSLYADPKRILDPADVLRRLPTALSDLDVAHLKAQLDDPTRRFIWIKRRLTPDEAQRANALGLPGVEFREEFVRVYPHRSLASHILGAVDVDNNGLAGVERSFDAQLARGEDVHLALDVRLQEMLRQRIADMMVKSEAKAAWGLVMKAPTREIVAMVSLPDYDPNHLGEAKPEQRFNHVTLGTYEMGSTFKLFTLAEGLANGKIEPDTLIDCRVPIQIGKYTIKDFHAKHAMLTANEVLRYSSNIGAAKIADMSGPEAQKDFMNKLGMLEPVNIGVSEIGTPRYPSNWGRIQTFTIAFGHGMSVTPVHLVNAVATLSDGFVKPASVLLGGVSDTTPKRLLDDATLAKIHILMRDVVLNGSGRSSQVVGYDIGGKTGTAEKIEGRGYAKEKNLVSFVGVLPMQNPEYITLVMIDEPKEQYRIAGFSAAPVVGQFYRDLTQMAGLKPDMDEVAAYRALLDKTKRKENDAYQVYTLSDFRAKRHTAGGVPMTTSAGGEDVKD